MMDALEGDLSFGVVGISTIVIGSFDGSWGLPVLMLTLLLALKYIGVPLFRSLLAWERYLGWPAQLLPP